MADPGGSAVALAGNPIHQTFISGPLQPLLLLHQYVAKANAEGREASAGGTSPGEGHRLGEPHSPQSEIAIRGRHLRRAVASEGSTEKVFSNFVGTSKRNFTPKSPKLWR